jgi:cytochrome c-type biogenesis protein CcmH
MATRLFLFLLTVCVLVPGVASAATVQEDPIERQVLDISKDLRCAVCQNQPVAESNADLAKDMRRIIREQLQAGKTRDEIVHYFVARYGDYVLMKPPAERAGLLLWVLPFFVLGVLALTGFVFLKNRRRAPSAGVPALTPQDRARIQKAREENNS